MQNPLPIELQSPVMDLIRQDFGLEAAEVDVHAFLNYLAAVIEHQLTHQPERLMSLLYRLDVDEHKILYVMQPFHKESPAQGLARLVWERQLERARTRKKYQSPPVEDEWKF